VEQRSGVLFHDRTPFTADDVIFSWQRARSEGSDVLKPPCGRARLPPVGRQRRCDPELGVALHQRIVDVPCHAELHGLGQRMRVHRERVTLATDASA